MYPTEKWPILTARIPPELFQKFEDYCFTKRMTKSDAVRLLMAQALQSGALEQEAIIQANARANAFQELSRIMDEALLRFKNETL